MVSKVKASIYIILFFSISFSTNAGCLGNLHKVFGKAKNIKIRNFVRKVTTSVKDYQKQYWSEVRSSYGVRILFRDKRGEKRTYLGYISNPIATHFDLPYVLTNPATMVTYGVSFYFISEAVNDFDNKQRQIKFSEVISKTPGGMYVFNLMKDGFIDPQEGMKIVINHHREFENWFSSENNKPLPRLEELQDLDIINEEELIAMNNLMRESSLKSQQIFAQRITPYQEVLSELDELIGKLTQQEERSERDEFVIKQAKDQKHQIFMEINLSDILYRQLKEDIASSSQFTNKSKSVQDLLATSYWPIVKVGKTSDLELVKEIKLNELESGNYFYSIADLVFKKRDLESQNQNGEFLDLSRDRQRESLQRTFDEVAQMMKQMQELALKDGSEFDKIYHNNDRDKSLTTRQHIQYLLETGQISFGQALIFLKAINDNEDDIQDKISRAIDESIFPQGRLYIADRTDLKFLNYELNFSGRGALSTELDYWKLMRTDPRFSGISSAWEEHAISDIQALVLLQKSVESYQQIFDHTQILNERDLTVDELDLLFDFSNTDKTNVHFVVVKNKVAETIGQHNPSEENIIKCFNDVARYWAQITKNEHELINSGMGLESFQSHQNQNRDDYLKGFESALEFCKK